MFTKFSPFGLHVCMATASPLEIQQHRRLMWRQQRQMSHTDLISHANASYKKEHYRKFMRQRSHSQPEEELPDRYCNGYRQERRTPSTETLNRRRQGSDPSLEYGDRRPESSRSDRRTNDPQKGDYVTNEQRRRELDERRREIEELKRRHVNELRRRESERHLGTYGRDPRQGVGGYSRQWREGMPASGTQRRTSPGPGDRDRLNGRDLDTSRSGGSSNSNTDMSSTNLSNFAPFLQHRAFDVHCTTTASGVCFLASKYSESRDLHTSTVHPLNTLCVVSRQQHGPTPVVNVLDLELYTGDTFGLADEQMYRKLKHATWWLDMENHFCACPSLMLHCCFAGLLRQVL